MPTCLCTGRCKSPPYTCSGIAPGGTYGPVIVVKELTDEQLDAAIKEYMETGEVTCEVDAEALKRALADVLAIARFK